MIICITGLDGCGKGSQKDFLVRYLRSRHIHVFKSKAYGDAEKESFSIFLQNWTQNSILFFFQALHVEQRVQTEQALLDHDVVIADRWDESYLAYHRTHGLLSEDSYLRDRLNEIAFGGILPDITFFLDTPVELAQKRMVSRGMDFFDSLPVSYHKTMREQYHILAKERGWVVIDGSLSMEQIHREIVSHVDNALGLKMT